MAPDILRHEGIFDHEALYKATSAWADAYGYKKTEKDMTRKYAPEGGEFKIKFTLKKNADDYVKYTIEIEIWVWRGVEIQLEEKGKQVKRMKGSVDIIIEPKISTNYEQTFAPTRWPQFVKKLTERFFWKKRLQDIEDKMYGEIADLKVRYKTILGYPTE